MKYEISAGDAFPVVKVDLSMGEGVKAESDAMVAMSNTIELKGTMDGGFGRAVGRMFSGESFFLQTLEAKGGDGWALLAPKEPGGIVDVELDGSYDMVVQRDGFLAGSMGLEISTKLQNLSAGLFSGEGFFVVKVSGKGTAFLSTYGATHILNLAEGEECFIDNGHLVAWPSTMTYEVTTAASGIVSMFTSGEGLALKFRGPGPVIIQTRNPKAFGGWVASLLPGKR